MNSKIPAPIRFRAPLCRPLSPQNPERLECQMKQYLFYANLPLQSGVADEIKDIKFLCLSGTIFDQETRVCERVDEVDCSQSTKFYDLNLELFGRNGLILYVCISIEISLQSTSYLSFWQLKGVR